MTALKKYQRIEATGLWRPSPDEQRREVVVSIGEATLTISDFNDRALTHWSLAALERQNPGSFPAIFHPDGDPDETLELAETETTMLDAIDRLQRAIDRARPHPGRLRWLSVGGVVAAVLALLLFWLPAALQGHVVSVVPQVKRQEIGETILHRIERVSGRACSSVDAQASLDRLAKRTGVRQIIILPAGVQDSLSLPGGTVVLNKSLVEDYEDPAVAAGYVIAERARMEQTDPLDDLLDRTGASSAFRLLTTGGLTPAIIDSYTEQVVSDPRPSLLDDQLLAVFAQAALPSTPYAYARDITGETVLGLIEADPMAGRTLEQVLPDRDWVRLQNICGE
ncbi:MULTISPECIES: hypothetical protein [unclassified Ruegeria]|uniref:hypothetical protein n=1 Tax=unclassified Ruegeria TaxID=2625375 RepID=UPI0014882F39|nr:MULTISPECIES: hypothetical protein [unclassified Ruegeria]NOD77516.1 hypothetical protein [Ruegeria sp. HKCCD4332]NOD87960.1 hypothetical protein [Ruegeria sp. HKCCD4318]NOE14330.1 hypothetical protein [Ruegeria sp. HKCCD4318-2]NOG08313.1 hypothetical protein [Ruegeria sp. HKCCD4315]